MSLSFYLSAGFGGSYVIYFPEFARRLGSSASAILLNRLVFLQTLGQPNENGEPQPLPRREAALRWLNLALETVAWETGLGRGEVKAARSNLEAAGLLRTRYKRLSHQLEWQVDFDTLDQFGDELSACFQTKEEKPLSGPNKLNDGHLPKMTIVNRNDVYIKAVAVGGGDFLVPTQTHPDLANQLAKLAEENHSAKPDSNPAMSIQQIRQALAKAKSLPDAIAAGIVAEIRDAGGWMRQAVKEVEAAARRQVNQNTVLTPQQAPTPEHLAGLELVGKSFKLTETGSTIQIKKIGARIAGKHHSLGQLSSMVIAGQLVEIPL